MRDGEKSEEIESKKQIKYNRDITVIGMGAMILMSLAAAYVYDNFTKKSEDYDQKLFMKTMAKADTNYDGVLQNEEIAGLLKKIGNESVIPDNKEISIEVGKRTWVYANWPGIKVYLGRSDLEKYLRDEN